ncbi:MAG: response regulator [Gammaproteobacteria bacterium]|nr:MAG: response regulator [Gammaproteobacteria bacterium]
MNQHVQKIAENLYTLTARKLKPLIVVVDDENNYISHYGELADYQLPPFEAGQSCIEALPFLVGLEQEPYVSLPIVNFNESNVSSVNVIRISIHRYVVLLEAGEEHQRQQQATQDSNEAKLLYQKLQKLTQQLEVANNAKSRFISRMSHEFRTPISSILGYSDLLASNYSSDDNELQYARAIESNTQYLLSLIDNVLEHAQLEADKLLINIAPFPLNELIDTLEHMFRAHTENSNISFNVQASKTLPKAIYSDYIRLQQILINLIGNAFKFTDEGSVTVNFNWEDGELIIRVSDTGPGIPVEHQANIFHAYNRYDANNKKGAGLGLAISAQIAEKLNGRLELESKFREGCLFILRVEARPADLSSIKSALLNNSAKNVLIVEDDMDLVELLKIYLDEFGYSTITATDGKDALHRCENEAIDLVLLDMQLPKLSGVDVVTKLREKNFNTPIIAMTASLNNDDKTQAMRAGCNEFLSKPIQLSPLMNAINNIFENHV